MVLNLNRAPKRLDAQKKDEHAQFSGSIPGSVSSRTLRDFKQRDSQVRVLPPRKVTTRSAFASTVL